MGKGFLQAFRALGLRPYLGDGFLQVFRALGLKPYLGDGFLQVCFGDWLAGKRCLSARCKAREGDPAQVHHLGVDARN